MGLGLMAWRGFGCDISQHGVSQPYGKGETGLDRLQLVSGFYIEIGLDPITLQAMPCTGGGRCRKLFWVNNIKVCCLPNSCN